MDQASRISLIRSDAVARRIQAVPVGEPESIQTMHPNLRVAVLKQEISMLEENVHGHTDAFVASETGTELAIRRAVEVRRLLISLNVDPERIRLSTGAGNFVANNSTPEGKAMNCRVEIELRKW